MEKPIEHVLKEFICHVVDLQNEDDPAGTGFHREFRILREAQIQNKNEDRFPAEDGRREENMRKNRYKDIVPRDDRRVKLKEIPGEKGSDYINASFIDDVDGRQGYIAAQGPMPHTVNDFWRMLWQYKTEIVFMACRVTEDGRPKCEKYWADKGEKATFGDITVTTVSEEEIQDHFMRRQLQAEQHGVVHRLIQFHYMGWPDHNTPSSPDALRKVIEDVRDSRKKMDIPMVVHCSAGCGRTGTVCAIDFAWTLLDKGMIKEGFSMFEIIKSLREQRLSMVQTPDQYEYTHMVMKSLCNEWLTSFSKNDYENVVIGAFGNAELEEPEDTYYNVDFSATDSSNKDSGKEVVQAVKPTPKDRDKAVDTGKPTPTNKPDMKKQKPEISKQKPEISRQKPEIVKQRPQVGVTVAAATSVASRPVALNDEAGEYVAVRQSATTTPSTLASPSSPPPALPNKKNPKFVDPHKTIIMLGASNADTKIVRSGQSATSAPKQQAPQAPSAALQQAKSAMSAAAKPVQQHQQQQKHDRQAEVAADSSVYGIVAKGVKTPKQASSKSSYENFPLQKSQMLPESAGLRRRASRRYNTQQSSNDSSQSQLASPEGPELPTRLYKPEEALPTTTTTSTATTAATNSSSSVPSPTEKGGRTKHDYDNVLPHGTPTPASPITTTATTTVSASPVPRLKPNRAPQPLPTSQAPSRGHPPMSPQKVVVTSAHRVVGPQPHSAAGPAAVRTAVSAGVSRAPVGRLVGHSTQQGHGHAGRVGPKSAQPAAGSQTATGFFKQLKPRKGLSMKGWNGKGKPLAPGQVLVAKPGHTVFKLERAPRVHGPRPMPQGWPTYNKNQRSTYL